MNTRLIALAGSVVVVCLLLGRPARPSRRSLAAATPLMRNWARLPAGTTWNGNTSWITADGKGLVVVLVRTAPYLSSAHTRRRLRQGVR